MRDGNQLKNEGDEFEYLAAAIFQAQGYYIRRSVPLRLETGLDATDIDVYGTKFIYPFQPTVLVCDCKDRSRSQASSRVFFVKGLASFIGANEAYVATRGAKIETVQFAQRHGVRVLTENVLREFAAQNASAFGRAYSHANPIVSEPFKRVINQAVRSDPDIRRAVRDASALYQHDDSFEDLSFAVLCIQGASSALLSLGSTESLMRTAWQYVLADLVTTFSIHFLYVCAEVLPLSRNDRMEYVFDRLTYGTLGKDRTEAIVNSTLALAEKSFAAPPNELSLELRPDARTLLRAPEYAHDLLGLIDRAFANSRLYHALPNMLDYILVDCGVGGKEYSTDFLMGLCPGASETELIKVTRNVLAFLRIHAALPAFPVSPIPNGQEIHHQGQNG